MDIGVDPWPIPHIGATGLAVGSTIAYCLITARQLLLLSWREGVSYESVLLVNHEDILAISGRLNSMVNRHFGRIEGGVSRALRHLNMRETAAPCEG